MVTTVSNASNYIGGASVLGLPLSAARVALKYGTNTYYSYNDANFWNMIKYGGQNAGGIFTETNIVNNTNWQTIYDQVSGGGNCTSIVFPSHAGASIILKITIDGTSNEYTLPSISFHYQFLLGAVSEDESSRYGSSYNDTVFVANPNSAFTDNMYIPYETSLKVEVKSTSSNWNTGTYGKKAGVTTRSIAGIFR